MGFGATVAAPPPFAFSALSPTPWLRHREDRQWPLPTQSNRLNLPAHPQEEAPAQIVILRPERRRLADHRRRRGDPGRHARRRGVEPLGDAERDPEPVGDIAAQRPRLLAGTGPAAVGTNT